MRLLQAELKDGVVYIDEKPAGDVVIMSNGSNNSKGRVLIDKTMSVYIVDTQPDLVVVIDELKKLCDQLITVGNHNYVIGAKDNVFGAPLAGVATGAQNIKAYLDGYKPL